MTNVVELEKSPLNIVLGVIFSTHTKKVLLVKRKKEANITGLKWCFPGGKIEFGEDLEKGLKRKIKEKIDLEVESLGTIFAEAPEKNNSNLLSVYYLCEFVKGIGKLNDELEEIKWVDPSDVEEYFGTELHPNLKEYLSSIK